MRLTVQSLENNRIDKYIADSTELTRSAVQRMIENGNILVNNKEVKVSYKLQSGDVIDITPEKVQDSHLSPENIPLDIVYEDKDILVVNKQKGLVVHPGNGNPNGTLVNAVLNHCKGELSGIGGEVRPGIVHRIDKDTSRTFNYCQK